MNDVTIFDGYEDDNSVLKFDLYLLTREIKSAISQLKPIALLSQRKQLEWVQEHKPMLDQYMQELVEEVMELFSDTDLDQDSVGEAVKCVTELRNLLSTLYAIMGEEQQTLS